MGIVEPTPKIFQRNSWNHQSLNGKRLKDGVAFQLVLVND